MTDRAFLPMTAGTDKFRIVITGGTGLLGPYLAEAAAALGAVTVAGRRGGDVPCDLTDETAAARLLETGAPELVFHCAALTDVDRCQGEPELAYRVNRDAATHIARHLPRHAALVYLSTDQVYADAPGPHAEGGEAPVNVYGASKLAGERAVLAHPGALVLRVNFFGPSRVPGRVSLSDWIAASLRQRRRITLFRDVLFSPLHLATLAKLAVEAARNKLTGVYNLGCREGASKLEFGLAVARHLGLAAETAAEGKSADVPARAPRPKDLRMDVTRIETALGYAMPTLSDEIAKL